MGDICCTCFGNYVPSNPNCGGGPKCNGGCFSLGTIIANDCNQPVYSCGVQVTVPFDCFCIPCEEPKIEVKSAESSKYTIDSITKDELVITTTESAMPGDRLEIDFKMTCEDDDCVIKSDYGKVVLFVESRCKGLDCGQCDECTGECQPEIIIDSGNKPEIKIY